MTLYSCSIGHMPSHRVTSAYSRPIESCSLTWAIRVSLPLSPMLTVADSRSPEPSQVNTRTLSGVLPQGPFVPKARCSKRPPHGLDDAPPARVARGSTQLHSDARLAPPPAAADTPGRPPRF